MVTVFALVLMVSACARGTGNEAAKAHTAKAHTGTVHADATHSNTTQPLPDLGIPPTPTPLSPGRYVTNEFEPSIEFSVGKGWAMNNPERKDHFSIYSREFAKSDRETGAVLTFVDVQAVFDAQEPTEDNIQPAPKNLLVWFQDHPKLDISNLSPTSVGGISAERFDTRVSSLPKERLDECPDCLPVFGLQYGEPISIVKGFEQRIFLVEGLSGKSVAIIFYAPPDQFDTYLPKAQGVLNTIAWRRT